MHQERRPSCPGLVEILGALALTAMVAFTPAAIAQTAGKFVPTGNMSVSRGGHTATLLKDGRVLITGGANSAGTALASAEIYDPSTAAFTPAGSMTAERSEHTAILLKDGRVLLAGGPSKSSSTSAEIYDPSTGTFQRTGDMLYGEYGVSLLSNGSVLFSGYEGAFQIYDPSTGRFGDAAQFRGSIQTTSATSLADGRILLIATPFSGGSLIKDELALIYDTFAGTFGRTGDPLSHAGLTGPLWEYTASPLANGNVLIAGGGYPLEYLECGDSENSARLYDPSTGTFRDTGSLQQARADHNAILLPGGKVLLSGGFNLNGFVASTELYDPSTETFEAAGNMTQLRSGHTTTLLDDGTVLITGGGVALSSAELYFPPPSAASSASLAAPLAPESLASIFGARLTTSTTAADTQSPPLSLGGLRVRVRDSAGAEQFAPLIYVSPSQINFEVPARTVPGSVTLEVLNGSDTISVTAQVRGIAPGLFTLPGNTAAAYATRIELNGAQTILLAGAPIVLDDRAVYLTLYGTGIRGRSFPENVKATIGGIDVPVVYAGPGGGVAGLDQVNLSLPLALKGNHDGHLVLTVDGVVANKVLVDVR